MVSFPKLTALLSVAAACQSSAFTAPQNNNDIKLRIPSSQLDLFGNAFANDDSLGKRENAGLKKVIDSRMRGIYSHEQFNFYTDNYVIIHIQHTGSKGCSNYR